MGILPLPYRSNRDHSVVADAEASPLLASPLGLASAGNDKSIGTTDSGFIRAFLGPKRSCSCLRRQRHPAAKPGERLKWTELAWRRSTNFWARHYRQDSTDRTSLFKKRANRIVRITTIPPLARRCPLSDGRRTIPYDRDGRKGVASPAANSTAA